MYYLKLIAVLLISSIFVSETGITAGKFYKWIDDKGQIHYTQTPPPANDKSVTGLVKIGGTGSSIRMEPNQDGKYLYCGKLKLPSAYLSDKLILQNIKLGLKDWMLFQKKAEQDYNSALTSQGNKKKIRKAKSHLDETSCRVTWANKRLNYLTSSSYKKSVELDKIEKNIKRLEKMRDYECPKDKNYHGRGIISSTRNPDVLTGDKAEKYYQCRLRYENDIKPLEKTLRKFRKKSKLKINKK